MGKGPTERTVVPREKKFPKEICFSPDKDYRFAARQKDPRIRIKHGHTCEPERERYQKPVVRSTRKMLLTRTPEEPEGPRPLCFPKESRENPFQRGFSGVFFLLPSVFFLFAKERKCAWTSWQVSASLNWRLRHCKKKQISY